MAKRRADGPVLLRCPPKRLCRSPRLVDAQRGSPSPAGGVNSPSLLASRSRKRCFYLESLDEQPHGEAAVGRKITRGSPAVTERTSACSSDRCSASRAPTCSGTWPRGDCTRLDTISPKIRGKADDHSQTEDCKFNSFQFWRSPVPALDLSLLEDVSQVPEEDTSARDSCYAMETG